MHNRTGARLGRAAQEPRVEADEGGGGKAVVPEERRAAEPRREGVEDDGAGLALLVGAGSGGGVGEVLGELAHEQDLQELGGLVAVGGDRGRFEGVQDGGGLPLVKVALLVL